MRVTNMQFTHIQNQFIQLLNIQQLSVCEEFANRLTEPSPLFQSTEPFTLSADATAPLSEQPEWHVLFDHSMKGLFADNEINFFADVAYVLAESPQLAIVLDETLATEFATQPNVFIVRTTEWLKTVSGKRQLWQWLWQQ